GAAVIDGGGAGGALRPVHAGALPAANGAHAPGPVAPRFDRTAAAHRSTLCGRPPRPRARAVASRSRGRRRAHANTPARVISAHSAPVRKGLAAGRIAAARGHVLLPRSPPGIPAWGLESK